MLTNVQPFYIWLVERGEKFTIHRTIPPAHKECVLFERFSTYFKPKDNALLQRYCLNRLCSSGALQPRGAKNDFYCPPRSM